jgi:hypothetical protein
MPSSEVMMNKALESLIFNGMSISLNPNFNLAAEIFYDCISW